MRAGRPRARVDPEGRIGVQDAVLHPAGAEHVHALERLARAARQCLVALPRAVRSRTGPSAVDRPDIPPAGLLQPGRGES